MSIYYQIKTYTLIDKLCCNKQLQITKPKPEILLVLSRFWDLDSSWPCSCRTSCTTYVNNFYDFVSLTVSQNRICVSLSIYFLHLLHFSFILFCLLHNDCLFWYFFSIFDVKTVNELSLQIFYNLFLKIIIYWICTKISIGPYTYTEVEIKKLFDYEVSVAWDLLVHPNFILAGFTL